MAKIRLAGAQMRVVGGDLDANLGNARRFIERAAQSGADIVLLPEALDVGWVHPASNRLASEIPGGSVCRLLAAIARENGIHVAAGITERAGGQIFNAAVLIDSDGQVLLHHRKLNELEIGHEFYGQGDRLGVVETCHGRLGLMICSDAFAPGQIVARTLGLMGAEIILSPCAWAVPPGFDSHQEPYGPLWISNYSPVARDFRLWIAGVSSVGRLNAGPWRGHDCIGNSLIVGPNGSVVAKGSFGEGAEEMILVEIETEVRPARGDGWVRHWQTGGAAC